MYKNNSLGLSSYPNTRNPGKHFQHSVDCNDLIYNHFALSKLYSRCNLAILKDQGQTPFRISFFSLCTSSRTSKLTLCSFNHLYNLQLFGDKLDCLDATPPPYLLHLPSSAQCILTSSCKLLPCSPVVLLQCLLCLLPLVPLWSHSCQTRKHCLIVQRLPLAQLAAMFNLPVQRI